MASSPAVLVPIIAATVCSWAVAQRPPRPLRAPEAAPRLVRVIVNWANAFDSEALDLSAEPDRSTEHVYEDYFVDGLGVPGKGRKTNHMAVLRALCFEAEKESAVDVARAVLHVAAAGFDRSLFDPEVLSVRDLGHWTLMRMEDHAVTAFLLDAAAGRSLSWYPWLDAEELPVAQQAAAMRLLGTIGVQRLEMMNPDVFRVPLESRLMDIDPRIRLAASEALGQMRRPQSLEIISRALVTERHPVVSQALVHAFERLVDLAREKGEVTAESVETALRALGRSGWRTDMALVDLAAEHPSKGVILPLIGVLEREEDDELVKAVNEKASPRLRLRAWEVLSELTGYRAPMDQTQMWREFWEREKENIEIYKREKPDTMTRATFFGIPVTGHEIAFIIDTSGSMEEMVARPEAPVRSGGIRNRRSTVASGKWSRLDAAKAQLLMAVESMDSDSRYHLITFSNNVFTWSRKPVRPGPASRRSLTGVLGKLQASGGTNVYDALFHGLGAEQALFGQQTDYGVDEIFLLSDGEPTSGQAKDPEMILRLVQELNRYQSIRINTVFTGTGSGDDFLRDLAEQNDGVFVHR